MGIWNQKANSSSGGDFPKAPAGNHPAVLVAIVDLGTQRNEYQGNVTWQRRAYFAWELTTEKIADGDAKGKNHKIGIDLTISLNVKSKLRQWIEGWAGKPIPDESEFDVSTLLGKKCLLSVKLNKGGYPVVDGMGQIPKGMKVPNAETQSFLFSLDEVGKDKSFRLPEWLESTWLYGERIREVIEYSAELSGKGPQPGDKVAVDKGKSRHRQDDDEITQEDRDTVPF
jgi:hypothetical protein